MTPEPVYIAPYDSRWPVLFEEERERVEKAIAPWVVEVEHVGSTAVPGLDAKPVIDIAVGLQDLGDTDLCVRPLEGIGYKYCGEAGVSGRQFFYRKFPQAYNLHLSVVGSRFWSHHLLFRDYLREHPATAREYAWLKHKLAELHRDDRETYTAAKAEFVAAVVAQAQESRT